MCGRDGELTDHFLLPALEHVSPCNPFSPVCLPASGPVVPSWGKNFFLSVIFSLVLSFQHPLCCLLLLPLLCPGLAFLVCNTCICYWTSCSLAWFVCPPSFLCICVIYVHIHCLHVCWCLFTCMWKLWVSSSLSSPPYILSWDPSEPGAH